MVAWNVKVEFDIFCNRFSGVPNTVALWIKIWRSIWGDMVHRLGSHLVHFGQCTGSPFDKLFRTRMLNISFSFVYNYFEPHKVTESVLLRIKIMIKILKISKNLIYYYDIIMQEFVLVKCTFVHFWITLCEYSFFFNIKQTINA